MQNFNLPALGGGAGLRHTHFDDILAHRPPFRWFEIINEDFVGYGGKVKEYLKEIRAHYPIIGHSVCISIGSTDPLDMEFLNRLKLFLDDIDSPWTSDHLCFTMVDHTNLNELIPLPFTDEAVQNVVARIRIVQDVLQRPFLIENVTRYITVSDREMNEIEFLSRILEEADCGLLLDVTNVYLNSKFHNFDPYEFIRALPLARVGQMHLSGFETDADGQCIDSHDAPVPEIVWNLFRETLKLSGPTSVVVEWDKSIPPVDVLLKEAQFADSVIQQAAVIPKSAVSQEIPVR